MSDTSRTHRCIDCPQRVEHTPSELCYACGRCGQHCHETDECITAATLPAREVQAEQERAAGTRVS